MARILQVFGLFVVALLLGLVAVYVDWRWILSLVALALLLLWAQTGAERTAAILIWLASIEYIYLKIDLPWFSMANQELDIPGRFVEGVIFTVLFTPAAFLLAGVGLFFRWENRAHLSEPKYGNPLKGPLALMFGYAVAGLWWSPNINWTFLALLRLAGNMLALCLIIGSVTSIRQVRYAVGALALGGAMHALMVIVSFALRQSLVWDIEVVRTYLAFCGTLPGGAFIEGTRNLRNVEFLCDYHITAMVMNGSAAALLGLLVIEKRVGRKVLLSFGLVLVLFVGLATNVRAGFLGLVGMIGFLLIMVGPFRQRALILGPVMLLLILALLALRIQIGRAIVGGEGGTRAIPVAASEGQKDGTVVDPSSRVFIWKEALRLSVESEGAGIGCQNFTLYTFRQLGLYSVHPHSALMSLLVDYGVVGLAILFWTGAVMLKLMKKTMLEKSSNNQTLALILWAGLIAVVAQNLIDFDAYHPFVWCYMGITVAASILALHADGRQFEGATNEGACETGKGLSHGRSPA